jgi:hypothetical protein
MFSRNRIGSVVGGTQLNLAAIMCLLDTMQESAVVPEKF